MDLCWMIVNFDNKESDSYGKPDKPGPLFRYIRDGITGLLLKSRSTDQDSWAGHRILCIGERTWDYPPGTLTDEELRTMDSQNDPYRFFSENYPQSNPCPHSPVNEELYILRNLSKCEYVRGNALAVKVRTQDPNEDVPVPGFTAALISRISWSTKTVNQWFTPIIYKTAIVPEYQLKNFQQTMETSNGRMLGKLVRRLYLRSDCYFKHSFESILFACTELESFSTNCELATLVAMRDKLSYPSPKYIIIDQKPNPTLDSSPYYHHPLLLNVTHMCVTLGDLSNITPDIAPHLTHLAVHSKIPTLIPGIEPFPLISGVLQSFPSLKSFILLCYFLSSHPGIFFAEAFWSEILLIDDPRWMVRPGLDANDYQAIKRGKVEEIWDESKMAKDWREQYLASRE